jgi:predicted GNAT family N-acyltransferase
MGAAEISIRWARGPDDIQDAFRVREQVFTREQGIPIVEDLDGLDHDALHLLAFESVRDHVIGTLRLLLAANEAKVGRVAVERNWRRRGVASRMLAVALSRAYERGYHRVRLAAQLDAIGLYERAGFTVESDPFEEAGVLHVWMGCWLTPET